MKKKISLFMAVVMTAVTLAACGGGKFTCDFCGETKVGKSYSVKVLGQTVTYCKDCKKSLDSLGSLFK